MRRHTGGALLIAVGLATVGLLAGCSSGGGQAPSATTSAPAAPTRTSDSTGSVPGGTGSPTHAAAGGSTDESGSGVPRCPAASLRAGEDVGSGGAAGSVYVHLTLENTGTASCTLQGWPGVSFVGDGTGTQIGAAASQDRASAHPTVTLAPGDTAVAPLKITNAQDYPPAECDPITPDGFRVYPPGSTESLFVKDAGHPACRSADIGVLNVQALVPAGQAAD